MCITILKMEAFFIASLLLICFSPMTMAQHSPPPPRGGRPVSPPPPFLSPPPPRGARPRPPPPPFLSPPPPPPSPPPPLSPPPPSPSPPPPSPPPPPPPSPPPPSPPPPSPPPPPPPSPPPPSPPPPSPPPPPPPSPPPPPPPSPPPPSPPPPSPPPPSPPPPPSSPPPPPGTIMPRLVRCRDPIRFPTCYNIPFPCPLACPRTCVLDCVACSPVCSCVAPGAVCQDPRFVGGDGMTFYFHGKKDKDFCLVSDPNLHINGHFIGKRNPKLTRDYTWVQSLGIMFDNHKLVVAAQKTSTWDDTSDRLALSFDGNPISLPTQEGVKWDSSNSSQLLITRTSNANGVTLEVMENFKLTVTVVPITAEESRVHNYNITKEDCFAHLELGFKFYNLTDEVDGVLGQTYRSNYVNKAKPSAKMPVMGGTHKYITSGLFAADCAVARFGAYPIKKDSSRKIFSLVSMNDKHTPRYYAVSCSSGMQGNGLVCK